MFKLFALLIKYTPILWGLAKEVLFTKRDQKYFIRNPTQVMVIILLPALCIVSLMYREREGIYAKMVVDQKAEIVKLKETITVKEKKIHDLSLNNCGALLEQITGLKFDKENIVDKEVPP